MLQALAEAQRKRAVAEKAAAVGIDRVMSAILPAQSRRCGPLQRGWAHV
jgi:hypothetical protein